MCRVSRSRDVPSPARDGVRHLAHHSFHCYSALMAALSVSFHKALRYPINHLRPHNGCFLIGTSKLRSLEVEC